MLVWVVILRKVFRDFSVVVDDVTKVVAERRRHLGAPKARRDIAAMQRLLQPDDDKHGHGGARHDVDDGRLLCRFASRNDVI